MQHASRIITLRVIVCERLLFGFPFCIAKALMRQMRSNRTTLLAAHGGFYRVLRWNPWFNRILMKCFDSKYSSILKTEIHCHLEGAIRTSTIIDVAKQHGLKLPAHDVAALDPHVKVLEQLKDLD